LASHNVSMAEEHMELRPKRRRPEVVVESQELIIYVILSGWAKYPDKHLASLHRFMDGISAK